ncbi:hypothetical protein V7131_28355, partial [Bacillus sp. JJ269]|uniref:hypothetical protein n=1 Tax=Bacillus sp. JJ269 TaxID=3122966 RepID=UPI002FFFD192
FIYIQWGFLKRSSINITLFEKRAEQVIVVVKLTYRHPTILNTMMMLQNIEQMKVKMDRDF